MRGKHLGSFLALGQESFSLGKRSLPPSPMNDFQICATENFSFACAVQDLCRREESSFTPSNLYLSVKPGKFTAARERQMLKQTEERNGLFPYRNLPDSKSGFIFFFSKRAKGKGQKQTRAREEMKVI
ncbi:hypothetical protein [uncultured Akkermansia sp.]|uniref:hypothetical protein n=1 Tax=uncultured Akkermansia sp. TaxID=512294 RepID=UPI00259B556B|nr:hypothetical protein [uncultured Akkermansia sp.]